MKCCLGKGAFQTRSLLLNVAVPGMDYDAEGRLRSLFVTTLWSSRATLREVDLMAALKSATLLVQ